MAGLPPPSTSSINGKLILRVVRAIQLHDTRFLRSMSPVLLFELDGQRYTTGAAKGQGKNPTWNSTLPPITLKNVPPNTSVTIMVVDDTDEVGNCQLTLSSLLDQSAHARSVMGSDGLLQLHLSYEGRQQGELFIDAKLESNQSQSAASSPPPMPVAYPPQTQRQPLQQPHQAAVGYQQQAHQPAHQPSTMQPSPHQPVSSYPMQPPPYTAQQQQQASVQQSYAMQQMPQTVPHYSPATQPMQMQSPPAPLPQYPPSTHPTVYPQIPQMAPTIPTTTAPIYTQAAPTQPMQQACYAPATQPNMLQPQPSHHQMVQPQPTYVAQPYPQTTIVQPTYPAAGQTGAPYGQAPPPPSFYTGPPTGPAVVPTTSAAPYYPVAQHSPMVIPQSAPLPVITPAPLDGSDEGIIPYQDLTIQKVIGEGTFATVSAGEFRATPVAIKVMKQAFSSPQQWQEFLSEVKFLRNARHPNIILFMGVTMAHPYCIVTELMDISLFDVLYKKKMQLTRAQKIHIALGIARGLASLHGHPTPIVHRDIKSLNVLVSNDLVSVKVADLGMVKLRAAAGTRLEQNGTPLWMAPEVLLDLPYDERADVFSYGCVLYEIVTSTIPFGGGQIPKEELVQRVGRQGERPHLPANLEEDWKKLLVQCWQQHPQARPSMAQIVQTLTAMKA